MNFGYASLNGEPPPKLEMEDEQNRYFIQLYHHVATAVDVRGKDVLEVGSGRGGGAAYIMHYLEPRSVLGVDIAQSSVHLCNTLHQVPGLFFQQGDAEALPLKDESFDLVLNIESSHCYGDMKRFISEVYRVLRPGGFFSFADLRFTEQLEETYRLFRESHFEDLLDEIITENVVAALDTMTEWKKESLRKVTPFFLRKAFYDLTAVKDTNGYNDLINGKKTYICFVMKKPGG